MDKITVDVKCFHVPHDGAYINWIKNFVKHPRWISEHLDMAPNTVIAFVRVTDTENLEIIQHALHVIEIVTNPLLGNTPFLGHNIFGIYWDSSTIDYDLENDLIRRAQSRFGNNRYRYYKYS